MAKRKRTSNDQPELPLGDGADAPVPAAGSQKPAAGRPKAEDGEQKTEPGARRERSQEQGFDAPRSQPGIDGQKTNEAAPPLPALAEREALSLR